MNNFLENVNAKTNNAEIEIPPQNEYPPSS